MQNCDGWGEENPELFCCGRDSCRAYHSVEAQSFALPFAARAPVLCFSAAASAPQSGEAHSRTSWKLLAILVPVILAVALLGLLWCCVRRKCCREADRYSLSRLTNLPAELTSKHISDGGAQSQLGSRRSSAPAAVVFIRNYFGFRRQGSISSPAYSPEGNVTAQNAGCSSNILQVVCDESDSDTAGCSSNGPCQGGDHKEEEGDQQCSPSCSCPWSAVSKTVHHADASVALGSAPLKNHRDCSALPSKYASAQLARSVSVRGAVSVCCVKVCSLCWKCL
jgi:hypothetical protein